MNSGNENNRIKWAFNSATIMNCGWEDELKLWREFGWSAAEIWQSKIQPRLDTGATLEQLSQQMKDAGVTPIGLCAGVLSTTANGGGSQQELNEIAKLLDVCAAMNARALTVVIIGEGGDDLEAQHDYLVERLRVVAEMAASRGVRINLEFLGGLPVNGTLGSCIELVNRADHPALGVLLDFCHYYASASHLEELALLPSQKLFAVHVDDAQRKPMERLTNEQRCFPGEGRIDVASMINRLRRDAEYDGYFTVELYDKGIWAMEPREVMVRLDKSLRETEQRIESQ